MGTGELDGDGRTCWGRENLMGFELTSLNIYPLRNDAP